MTNSGSESSDECIIVPIPELETRQIVAGQAVSDIASTVKELVDNALDAGSRVIKIKLFNQGIDVIEVSDDGCGIPMHSRPLVAMKHATSKLRTFSSLYEDTYVDGKIEKKQLGFRGEALFSMANVSQNLIIMTQTQDDNIGQRFEFRRDGYLNQNSLQDVQRKVGTTVAVVKIFDALPVRRADLIKRIKVQRANMLRLMQAYAVLCVGVCFNVIDITGPVGSPKCKQEVKLQTSERSKSVKETVSAVFGSKFLAGMCPIVVDLSLAVSKAGKSMKAMKNADFSWRIEGLVSKAPNALTSGKTARDIQLFSVNGRPVECPQIAKTVSSVWRNFDSGEGQKKRPACILCLHLPSTMFDVNLVPDKREILITEEITICELLRDKLNNIWTEHTGGKFEANEVESQSNMREPNNVSITKQKLVENNRQVVNIEPKRGKMRRRNACYISFDNIGTKAPDYEHSVKGKGTTFNSSFDSLRNLVPHSHDEKLSNDRPNNLEASAVSSILPFCSNGAVVQSTKKEPQDRTTHENIEIRARHDSSNGDNNRPADPNLSEDTMLLLNTSRLITANVDIQKLNSQPATDDEHVLPQGKEDRQEAPIINGNNSAPGESNVSEVPIEPLQKDPTPVEVASKSLSIQSIKQFSFQPGTDKVNNVVSPDSFVESNSSVSRIGYRGASKAKSIPAQNDSTACNSPTQDFSRKRARVESLSLRQHTSNDDQYDLPKVSNTPLQLEKRHTSISRPLHLQAQAEGTSKKQKGEEISEICWDGFNGTSEVVKLAQASRIQMRNTRKNLLKRHTLPKSSSENVNGSEHQEISFETDLSANNKTVSLAKEEFVEMRIIGQFNLGFILAMCKNNHLWILDQHACDEKYNFEKMFAETKVHEQQLIKPLPLELSPSEEHCVVENMRIFVQNGFRFRFDVRKPVRHRLSLTSIPHSGSGGDGRKAVQFGKEDVGALCAILGADGDSSSSGYIAGSGTGADGGGSMGNNAVRRYAGTGRTIIRLPKAVAMFASRACRSSVMIGDSLSKQEMEQIVRKLDSLEQPWDCPHGRPTIRHVKNLIENIVDDEDLALTRVTGPSLAVMDQD